MRKIKAVPGKGIVASEILGMGVNKPASIEPSHERFDATLDPKQIKQLVLIANKTNNQDLVNGLIKLVKDDIDSDVDAGNVSKASILKHYEAHVEALKSAKVGNISNIKQILD